MERVVFIVWKDGGSMFKVNDTIMYGTQGVCKIIGITEKDFMGDKKEYYELKPMNNKGATLFAPVNVKAGNKMRRILTKEEVQELIAKMPSEEMLWISSANLRKETYKKIVYNGDHIELIRMIKALHYQREKREAAGKHLYLSDERFLKEAERILCEEFQYVLELNKEQLIAFIIKK